MGFINVELWDNEKTSSVHEGKLVIIKSERKFTPLAGRTLLDVLFPGWRSYILFNSRKANQHCNMLNKNVDNGFQKDEIIQMYFQTQLQEPLNGSK